VPRPAAINVVTGLPTSWFPEEPIAEKTVRVKVNAPFRVVHECDPYSDGDEVSVPEATAQLWERSGFVERVTGKG
jgi:hypothetical protein